MAGEDLSKKDEALAYEEARRLRIAENNRRMQELGIHQAVAAIEQTAVQKESKPVQPRKRKSYTMEVECRRSGRLQGSTPDYAEDDELRDMGIDRLDLLTKRRRRVNVDPEQIKSIRENRAKELGLNDSEAPIGAFDSGLGVRIQGGRVYDSMLGTTCHWCRQKTLEPHVMCTDPGCGGGKKLAVTFCKMCLMNRHGEDIDQAIASGQWICPVCRGSCGQGCTICCNCGPCRKKAGLAPTHQIIKDARAANFSNVHDYLVYRSTKETPEEIAARKATQTWGAWLSVPYTPPTESDEETVTLGNSEKQAARPSRTPTSTARKQRTQTPATATKSAGAPSVPASAVNVSLSTAATAQKLQDSAGKGDEVESPRKLNKMLSVGPKEVEAEARPSSARKQRMLEKLGLS